MFNVGISFLFCGINLRVEAFFDCFAGVPVKTEKTQEDMVSLTKLVFKEYDFVLVPHFRMRWLDSRLPRGVVSCVLAWGIFVSLPEGVNDVTDDTRTFLIYCTMIEGRLGEQVAVAIELLSVVTTSRAGYRVICCE